MKTGLLPGLGLSLLLVAMSLHAHEAHAPAAPVNVPPAPSSVGHDAQSYFTDTRLLTQDGETVRFYSDVLKDRIVLLNVIFTSCNDACPLITRKLRDVREALGARAEEVLFVSLTSDPLNDTPPVLKAFARQQGADQVNWLFLTGDKADMDRVLGRLGHLAPAPEAHSTQLIAGDVANKRWSKIRPDAQVGAIAQRLLLLAEPLVGR